MNRDSFHVSRFTFHCTVNAGIDYLDIHFQQSIVLILNGLAPDIEKAGRCFITQAGFHPGLPAAFVRGAALHFSRYKRAVIGMAMNARIEKPESVYELIDEISDYQSDLFKEGKWKKGGYHDAIKIDFGSSFGIRTCYPMQMEEIKPLPEMFGLEEVGIYVAGFNWFVDYIVFPLAVILTKIRKGMGRGFLAKLMVWGINTFSSPNQGVVFILEADGEKNGKPVRVRIVAEHNDAYYFTAIPVVACLLQYLDGGIVKPGLWMMGHIVEPARLMKDMERMGVSIQRGMDRGMFQISQKMS